MAIIKERGGIEQSRLPVKTSTGEYRIAEILASKPVNGKSGDIKYYVHYVECKCNSAPC